MSLRQIIGIPLGSEPAPFMANLFSYYNEKEWLLGTKKIIYVKHGFLVISFVL